MDQVLDVCIDFEIRACACAVLLLNFCDQAQKRNIPNCRLESQNTPFFCQQYRNIGRESRNIPDFGWESQNKGRV